MKPSDAMSEDVAMRGGRWINADDVDALVRRMDAALNGERAARQASLCDLVAQIERRAAPAPFQSRVAPWMQETFGPEISGDMVERGDRLIEEVFELVQAIGYDEARIPLIQRYTFDRPVGEPSQEVGGVMVCLAALCLATGLDMHGAAETELERVWTKVETIRAKQAAKPKHSPLPSAPAPCERCKALEAALEPFMKAARMAEKVRPHSLNRWWARFSEHVHVADFRRAAEALAATREPLPINPPDKPLSIRSAARRIASSDLGESEYD